MSKLNLDEIFQQKLNQLKIQHKPEYWSKMEEELDAAAPVGVGGVGSSLSKIYLISGIVTSIVVISFIGYFAFKNHSFDNFNNKENKMLMTSLTTSQSSGDKTKELADIKAKDFKKQIKEPNYSNLQTTITKQKSTQSVSDNRKIIDNAEVNSSSKSEENIQENAATKITKLLSKDRSKVKTIIIADVLEIDNIDNLYYYDRKSILNKKLCKNENVVKESILCNELIVVKPIDKPVKKVFQKRKGILYKLGIRK